MADCDCSHGFYVYIHRRKTDHRPFYVGKGNSDRAWQRRGRNIHWHRVVWKHGYYVEIVQSQMQEWWAHELEIDLIAFYGKENLSNITDGGEGVVGLRHRPESKRQMSLAKTGKKLGPNSEEVKAKKRASNIGKHNHTPTAATREKISAALKGVVFSEERRRRISLGLTGKKASPSHLLNLVTSHGGKMVLCHETGQVFHGASPAAAWLRGLGHTKASAGAVSNTCHGRSKHAYGYRFSHMPAPSP